MEVGRGGKPAEPQTTARNGALEPLNDMGKPWRVTGSKSTGWAGGPVDCWKYSVERGNTARMDGDDEEVP